jgi:hemoglobin
MVLGQLAGFTYTQGMASEPTEHDVYTLIGDEGFTRLVAGFYRRVAEDDLLGAMYPRQDLAGAAERLRGFLVQRFGGPDDYSQRRGHPRLRMRHAPFRVDQAARDRWITLMEQSLTEAQFPEAIERMLRAYFHDTATFMINHADGS